MKSLLFLLFVFHSALAQSYVESCKITEKRIKKKGTETSVSEETVFSGENSLNYEECYTKALELSMTTIIHFKKDEAYASVFWHYFDEFNLFEDSGYFTRYTRPCLEEDQMTFDEKSGADDFNHFSNLISLGIPTGGSTIKDLKGIREKRTLVDHNCKYIKD